MKIATEQQEIIGNLEGEQINFRIGNSPIIFDILRNKMYSNSKASVVREICDNGRDSHRLGNVTQPLEIIVGDYLVIRDFGVGMSPEHITEVYSVYGESSKRSTNKYGGGFGLGAKTPFAVTDQFLVITHWEGIKYTYSLYIDETRCGVIKCIGQEESTDVGTTVKIPIAAHEKQEYLNYAIKYTKYYPISGDPLPVVVGYERKYEPTWYYGFLEAPAYDDPHLVINGIPYELNESYFQLPVWSKYAITFETGELELSSSRERIQENEKNRELIKKRFDEFVGLIKEDILNKDYDSIRDYLKAIKQYRDLTGKHTYYDHEEYEWGDFKFKYPFDGSIGKEIYVSGGRCQNGWLQEINEKPVVFVDTLDITSELRRRICRFFPGKHIVLFKKGTFPIDGTNVEDLKHDPKDRTYTPRAPRPKGVINVRYYDGVWISENIPVDSEGIYYTEKLNNDDLWRWEKVLDKKAYRIAEGNVKRVKNMVSLKDAKQAYLDSLDKDAMEKLYYYSSHCSSMRQYEWTKHPDIDWGYLKKLETSYVMDDIVAHFGLQFKQFNINLPYAEHFKFHTPENRKVYLEYLSLKGLKISIAKS